MLQMAVDVLLDLDNKAHLLAKMVKSDSKSHANYGTGDFKMFLDTLVETVQKHDPYWNEAVEQVWLDVRDEAMGIKLEDIKNLLLNENADSTYIKASCKTLDLNSFNLI